MIRIALVGFVRIYRESLTQLLERDETFHVVATSFEDPATLSSLPELAPDVILLDTIGPDTPRLINELRRHAAAVPLVAIGVAASDPELVACTEFCASGYVTRDASIEELVATMRRAARGELICSPRTAGQIVRRLAVLSAGQESGASSVHLTPRETEIARLIQDELSNKEIAKRLSIEVATVKNHVHNLLEKLKSRRRSEVGRTLRQANVAAR